MKGCGDALTNEVCRAVGWVKGSTRVEEIFQLGFQQREFSLSGTDIFDFPDETGSDVLAGLLSVPREA